MSILIIGSKGFIGSNLVNYLNKKTTVFKADVVADYIEENYTIINGTNYDFDLLFSKNKYDVCINCSGAADVNASFINTNRDFLLNTVNVFYLLEAIKNHQPNCKFINLSSAAIYGNPNKLPIKESSISLPISPYGFHKLNAELLSKEYNNIFNIPTCTLRIFSAYGEGLTKQLFWDIYQKTKLSDSITLFGTGNESRDFINIHDICQAVELVIQKCDFNANIINIANGEEVFIKDAVFLFLNLLDWTGSLFFDNKTRKGNPNNWIADISLLQELGYKKAVSLDFGLSNYVKWLKERE